MKRIINVNSITEKEWVEERKKGIGGSDVATIFGLNKWKSPIGLYLEKIEETQPEDLTDNEAVYWGKQHEPMIAKEFAIQTGLKVRKCNFVLAHDEYNFIRANIDREIVCPERGRGVLEIKTTSEWNKGEWSEDTIPNPYMLQIQHYLLVTGYSYGYVAVLIGGNKYKHWLVERDEELIAIILNKEIEFWNRIKTNNPPPIDGSDASKELLDKLYPAGLEDATARLSWNHEGEIVDMLSKRSDLLVTLSDTKGQVQYIENQLKEKLGNFTEAECYDFRITWKSPAVSYTVPVQALRTKYPEVYEELKKPKAQTRRFAIKEVS